MFRPESKRGGTKYGGKNEMTKGMLAKYNISGSTREALEIMGSHGLAKSTWSTYATAKRMLAMCGKAKKKRMDFPLQEDDVLEFVGWLAGERKVKAGTISSYLAGLRQLHLLEGMEPPAIRSDLVKFLLQGKKNMDNIKARTEGSRKRLPMTIAVMKLLKEEIRRWEVKIDQKLLTWAIATIAFHGAFRIHELLNRVEGDFALLGRDVKVKTDSEMKRRIEIKLKCPKENRSGKVVIVDIFESGGTLCPVKAFTRWQDRRKSEDEIPIFRDDKGIPVTGRKMNSWLKTLLEKHVDYDKARFTSHSFRIGLATTLGTLGFSTDDIKEAGRWSSNAYQVYMRLPRQRRLAVAEKISKLEKGKN
jgi:hypothetical protein